MSVPAVRRIVVGVDGSADSVIALRWACREAAIRGAEVHAVHVREAPLHSPASYAVPTPADGYALASEEAEEGFRSLAVPIVHPAGVARYALNIGRVVSAPADDLTRFLPILKEAARELQAQLV